MDANLFIATIQLLFSVGLPILAIVLIIRAIKRHSDRKYELEKYKAETERMKAEAEAKKDYDPEL